MSFLLGINILLAVYSLVWDRFLFLDVGVSGQLALRVITLCQKESPASLNSIQNSITFNFLPILHFRSSPALFLVVA